MRISDWSSDVCSSDLNRAPREKGVGLWSHLRRTLGQTDMRAPLYALLGQADLTTPYRYLEHILSGPLDGRRKLLSRLGAEARDHIDELLNAAQALESDHDPSLQMLIDWLDDGKGGCEGKRVYVGLDLGVL